MSNDLNIRSRVVVLIIFRSLNRTNRSNIGYIWKRWTSLTISTRKLVCTFVLIFIQSMGDRCKQSYFASKMYSLSIFHFSLFSVKAVILFAFNICIVLTFFKRNIFTTAKALQSIDCIHHILSAEKFYVLRLFKKSQNKKKKLKIYL